MKKENKFSYFNEKLPKYKRYTDSNRIEYVLDEKIYLNEYEIDWIAYSYVSYSEYEGGGCALFVMGNKVYESNFSHCSCYPPEFELYNERSEIKDLVLVQKESSPEKDTQLYPLIKLLRAFSYEWVPGFPKKKLKNGFIIF